MGTPLKMRLYYILTTHHIAKGVQIYMSYTKVLQKAKCLASRPI